MLNEKYGNFQMSEKKPDLSSHFVFFSSHVMCPTRKFCARSLQHDFPGPRLKLFVSSCLINKSFLPQK